jgi:hypothetical protein
MKITLAAAACLLALAGCAGTPTLLKPLPTPVAASGAYYLLEEPAQRRRLEPRVQLGELPSRCVRVQCRGLSREEQRVRHAAELTPLRERAVARDGDLALRVLSPAP